MAQLVLGIARAGIIGKYFPASVIQGMLAAIGIIIFIKQIPHGLGYAGAEALASRRTKCSMCCFCWETIWRMPLRRP